MIELKIRKWSDITVGDYNELLGIDRIEDPVEKQATLLAFLTDTSTDEIYNLKLNEYSQLNAQTSWLFNKPEPISTCPETIELNGQKYNVTKDLRNITAGQYIDFNNYLNLTNKDNEVDNLPEILSCFFVPEGSIGYNDGYDIDLVKEDIKWHMPILQALDVCFFFTNLFHNLTKAMAIYLVLTTKGLTMKQRMKILRKLKQLTNLVKSGVGPT